MSRLGKMTYGDLDEVDSLLEEDCSLQEIGAALQNVIRHVLAIEVRAEASRRIAERAANTASCLANGIKPD